MVQAPIVVRAEGGILERVQAASLHPGLSRRAFTTFDAVLDKTAWAPGHRRRYALIEGGDVLASAQRYDLPGILDQQRLRICGIGAVCHVPAQENARPRAGPG